jgi:hypothetical protein
MSTAAIDPRAGAGTGARTGVRAASLPAFAAALSLSAAIAHFGVTAPHFREWWAHGAFFLACGITQTLFAALILWRPRWDWLSLTGIAGNLAIIAMYALSRTAGIPLGPHAGVVEEAGAIDLGVTAAEVAIVACALTLLRPRFWRLVVEALLLAGAALWLLRLTDRLP